ncbi:MAG: hypothetical protein P8N54_08950 [Flavobacteriales bacterium]|nr:hypothetical protein [Flavobacteriales bacterium]MDG1395933.1 hypothetical protein [Flavobacteriales bacterium]
MYLKFKNSILLAFLILIGSQVLFAQSEPDLSEGNSSFIGLFPKDEAPQLYTFKLSGEYRFLGSFVHNKLPYQLTDNIGDVTKDKVLFIGDDSQLPQLTLRFSGRPSLKTSWGFDLYTFQFLEGNVKPTYSAMIAQSNRPTIYDPINGTRLAGSFGMQLGISMYGSFDTDFGSFLVKAGGIHWTSISDLTMASFRGYNRFSLFERNPWDPLGASSEQRYFDFHNSGNIQQDTRWGEKAFTGLIIEGSNLPKNTSLKALFGKTELNGGFTIMPNYTYGGQLRKNFPSGNFIGLNTFNSKTYVDSVGNESFGFNIATLESHFKVLKFGVKLEAGLGRALSSTEDGDWGEALHLKVASPTIFDKVNIEAHMFRISPNVINNNSVFLNSSILQNNSNNLAAGSVGSSAVLQPFASQMSSLGMMSNNRQGINLNTEIDLDELKLSFAIGASGEIDALSSQLTYGHPVNQLTRSRLWRWNFPANVGPYGNQSVIYRDVYETVNLTGDELTRNYFSGIEFQAKYHPKFLSSKLYLFSISRVYSAQESWSAIPVLSDEAYVKQYNNEFEAYYAVNSKFVLNGYLGFERTIANYKTDLDVNTDRPRDQFGNGYGLGIDYTIAKNTAIFIRHRWFEFEDKSFEKDHFKGTETSLELKISF